MPGSDSISFRCPHCDKKSDVLPDGWELGDRSLGALMKRQTAIERAFRALIELQKTTLGAIVEAAQRCPEVKRQKEPEAETPGSDDHAA